jgi:hypothetical protein
MARRFVRMFQEPALYQGLALAMPKQARRTKGFSPCGISARTC